jgi:hypothetical protein
MATIKEAVDHASRFAQGTLGPERTAGLQLEEVESTNVGGEEAWLITLSMIAPPQGPFHPVNVFAEPKRDYKVFKVLKKNGEVASMKIRELAAM